jgi:CRISPR-associated protein Cmr5
MAQTLDQQRAQFAWDSVTQARKEIREFSEYKNLAKGAPALIMGNGLMPAIAFYESKKKPHTLFLQNSVLAWLAIRFKDERAFQPLPSNFNTAMERLLKADAGFYMRATDEALAMLKWLRQFADAVEGS